jgi:hypothetical protein
VDVPVCTQEWTPEIRAERADIGAYLITQATGDGIGTAPHAAGLSGFAAGLGAALEAVLIIGCGWLLTARPGQRVRRQRLITAPAVTGVMTAALLGVALATAGPGAQFVVLAFQAGLVQAG